MSANGPQVVGPPGDVVTTVGIEHIRLSYEYLDRRDLDGYGSLFDDEAELCSPVAGVVRGRAGIESYQAERAVDGGRHVLDEVFSAPVSRPTTTTRPGAENTSSSTCRPPSTARSAW